MQRLLYQVFELELTILIGVQFAWPENVALHGARRATEPVLSTFHLEARLVDL